MFIKDVLILIKELKIKGQEIGWQLSLQSYCLKERKKTSLLSDPQKAQNLNI
jgi:hypothetical protein